MEMQCVVDGHFGIYVPQVFAERFGSALRGSTLNREEKKACIQSLKNGPDDPDYWESWSQITSFCCLEDSLGEIFEIVLGESGDVFAF